MIGWLRTLKWRIEGWLVPDCGEPDSQISEPRQHGDAEQCQPDEERED